MDARCSDVVHDSSASEADVRGALDQIAPDRPCGAADGRGRYSAPPEHGCPIVLSPELVDEMTKEPIADA